MTRYEYMQKLPPCDILIIDEIDETVLHYPYEFQNNSNSAYNGIWKWNSSQVIGLSATAYGDI